MVAPRQDAHVAVTDGTPAVEGWFTPDPPALLGLRCTTCRTTVFPPRATTCPNPTCRGDELATVTLARTGTVWSWAVNHYPPPAPYVAADPFEPTTVVAVELDGESLTVLGQLDHGDDPTQLALGTPVEVVLGEVGSQDGVARSMFRFRVVDGAGEVSA